jgi:four helix bundle protein
MVGRLATDFTELEVYQNCRELARELFQVTKAFPREEKYALTAQLRRASRSIGAQIAEAWGKRLYPRHFLSKLSDADAEQLETRHWIGVAEDCGYLSKEQAADFVQEFSTLGRMLNAMMKKARSFSRETGLP